MNSIRLIVPLSVLSRTNIRTYQVAVLVLAACLGTYGATAQPVSIAGNTVLTPADVVDNAASTPQSFAVAVWPAPYLLPELTRGLLIIPTPVATVGLGGGTGGGWTDVSVLLQSCWAITPAFDLGASLTAGWKGASGFAGYAEASVDIAAHVRVDSAWSLGMGIDAGLYYAGWPTLPPRRLRLGVGYTDVASIALDVEAHASNVPCVMISGALPVGDDVGGRVSVRTQPLAVGCLVRWTPSKSTACSFGVDHVLAVGFRMLFIVEL